MKIKDFEDFLAEQCEKEGGFEGVLDDDYEDAFERWLEEKEVGDMIDYGNQSVKEAFIAGMDKVIGGQKPIR